MSAFARTIVAVVALATLSACSTIIQGNSQNIAVSSSPSGAYCTMERDGKMIAKLILVPASVTVEKTKDDILLTCNLPGYASASQYLHSGIATGTYGNIILGGLVGWGIDSATGADNEYPATVNVNFVPSPVAQQSYAAPPSVAPPAKFQRYDELQRQNRQTNP